MNITVVTSIFPPDIGGPSVYASEILKRLNERGHSVRVITLSETAEAAADVRVVARRRPKPGFIGYVYTHLALFLSIIQLSRHCHVIYTLSPAYIGFVSLMAAKILRKPIVLRMAGDVAWEEASNKLITEKFLEEFHTAPEGGKYIKRLIALQRFVLNRMDKIIVPSHFLKDVVVNYYGTDYMKVTVIYNSANLPDYQKPVCEASRMLSKPKLIAVGRLARHKRVDRIIEVVKEISEVYNDISLLIVGDGPERGKLEKLSQALGTSRQVSFYGKTTHKQTAKLMAEADIFVLNSVYEGLPHVALEAMAFRVPVIATNIRGTNEAVKDGETGLLIPPDDNTKLMEGIIRLIKDEGLRKQLIENGYESVREKFTWANNINILERELAEIT
ncbi:glycosyltransferase family 4 protein [Chloroflexota bacterium]